MATEFITLVGGEIADFSEQGGPTMALDHYDIERAADATPNTFVYIGSSVKKEYTDANLKPNNAYWYRVFAVDDFGIRSSPSKPLYVSLYDTVPAAPTNLIATYITAIPATT